MARQVPFLVANPNDQPHIGAELMTMPRFRDKSQQEDVSPDLLELAALITELPSKYRAKLEPVVSRVFESTRRRRRILNLVQEALSQLRLDMKYLVFDLEATRRERDELRGEGEENKGTENDGQDIG